MDTHDRVMVKQQPVLGGYDPARYETVREWATAADGAATPVVAPHTNTTGRPQAGRSRPRTSQR